VLLNAQDGRVLYSLNPDERLPMASTTKMMTALIVVEDHVEDHSDLKAKVTVGQRAAALSATTGGSSINLQEGESLTLEQMLNGMLISSGNDAAVALAEYDAGSVKAFVGKMNQKAHTLGLTNTHYANPHGLDEKGHYTSAMDNAKLGTEVMKHGKIREIVDRYEYTIPGTQGPRHLVNTNDLLDSVPCITGIKTGSTDDAGYCIVISASKNGVRLIFSYLGGPSLAQRDEDVMNMLAYGFAQYGVTIDNRPPSTTGRPGGNNGPPRGL
jgi:D-alanyl-D-alanine carboxypeptidase (penicillin-binding protein 5/6)